MKQAINLESCRKAFGTSIEDAKDHELFLEELGVAFHGPDESKEVRKEASKMKKAIRRP